MGTFIQLFTTLYIVYKKKTFTVMKFFYTILALFLLLALAHAQDGGDDTVIGGDTQGADTQGADTQGGDTQGADTQEADTQGADTQGADTQGADTQGDATQGDANAGSSDSTTQQANVLNENGDSTTTTTQATNDDSATENNDAAGDDATAGFACKTASSMFTALAVGIVAAYNF